MTAIPQEGTSSNRYLILGRLAGGGMADIFLARSTSEAGVDRYVVLKRVLAERSKDPHFATMFLDEARLAAQLQHPNIAQVHDIGKLGGSYFYTMEYVHGEDLRHVLQRLSALRRPFPIPLLLHVATGALAGLHHAHMRTSRDGKPLGVVHRDVTPSNVMISYEGTIKMLDFGVAKATQRSAESRSGTIKGKIAYLSPEQCQSNAIDRRSDIYSLGIVMHEMLNGRRLYKRDTDFATMMAIVQEPVRPPSAARADVSPELDRIVMTALDKDPARRFATAADMIEAIESFAAREQHVLSGTALGKFMRELFGDRPEPWLEIQEREEDAKAITVTGESVAGLDPLAGAVPIAMSATASGGHLVAERLGGSAIIEQQLDAAPHIGRPAERGSDSLSLGDDPSGPDTPGPDTQRQAGSDPNLRPTVSMHASAEPPRTSMPTPSAPIVAAPMLPRTSTPTPSSPIAPRGPISAITTIGVAPAPPLGMQPAPPSQPMPMPTYPTAPPEMMAEYRSQTNTPVFVVPLWRRRSFVIVASALLVVITILTIVKLAGGNEGSPTLDAATPAIATTIDATIDATIAAVGLDAAVVANAPADAAVVPSPPHEPTLADLVAAGSYAEVAKRCAETPPATNTDRARCGIAACRDHQKGAAVAFYNATSGSSQPAIERACKDAGIVLKPHVTAAKNPCDEKRYREENPLKCQ